MSERQDDRPDENDPAALAEVPESGAGGKAGAEPGVTIDFDEIANGSRLVQIRYRGQVYLLRSTRNGKLILNK